MIGSVRFVYDGVELELDAYPFDLEEPPTYLAIMFRDRTNGRCGHALENRAVGSGSDLEQSEARDRVVGNTVTRGKAPDGTNDAGPSR